VTSEDILKVKHTFLFEPAAWVAEGQYIDSDGVPSETVGDAIVVHEPDMWIRNATFRVQSNPPMEFRDRYTVKPLAAGHVTTMWTSDNAIAGQLFGTFLFSDDAIVSVFSNAAGDYSGSEYIKLEDDGHYTLFGSMLRGKRTIFSWRLTLTRRA
jgi:hypothetical protein